jgi:hypothetical protein
MKNLKGRKTMNNKLENGLMHENSTISGKAGSEAALEGSSRCC